ncbi:MAG: hypothetical protein HY043_01015 [Verrucomicrobia bacterium]|nr:hypothetical protein [Verrucomicrobiota bacterium]
MSQQLHAVANDDKHEVSPRDVVLAPMNWWVVKRDLRVLPKGSSGFFQRK